MRRGLRKMDRVRLDVFTPDARRRLRAVAVEVVALLPASTEEAAAALYYANRLVRDFLDADDAPAPKGKVVPLHPNASTG